MLRSTLSLVAITLLLAASAAAHPHDGEDAAGGGHGSEAEHGARYGWGDSDRWHVHVGGGAGYAEPWQGSGGVMATGHVLAASPTGRFRIGLEGLYRHWDTRLFRVREVDIDTYAANVVFHYVPFPKAFATPYIGAGIGLQVNDVSERDVENGTGKDLRDDIGVGFGITGIVGLEVPLGRFLALYVEGRLTAAYMVTGEDEDDRELYADYAHSGVDDTDAEDTGAAAAIGGVRIRF